MGKTLRYIVFLIFGIILLYISFKEIEWVQFWNKLKTAKLYYLILSMVAALLAYYIRSLRWNLLLKPIGVETHSTTLFHSISFGYLCNLAFPRLGEIARPGTAAKLTNHNFSKLFGTIVVERLIDTITLFVLLLVVVVINFQLFGHFFVETIFFPFFKLHTTSTVILLSVIILLVGGVIYFRRVICKRIKFLQDFVNGMKSLLHLQSPFLFIFYTLLLWGVYWFMGWIVLFCLPATSVLTLTDGLFILILGSLGLLAPTQGGIGAYHFIISLGLTIFGISREDGLLYATLSHTSQVIFTLLVGLASYLWILLKRRNISK